MVSTRNQEGGSVNQQVEELVERVARKLQKMTDFACNLEWEDFDDTAQAGFISRAEQLLSHPDLCLINHSREGSSHYSDDWKPVIPLAEALETK